MGVRLSAYPLKTGFTVVCLFLVCLFHPRIISVRIYHYYTCGNCGFFVYLDHDKIDKDNKTLVDLKARSARELTNHNKMHCTAKQQYVKDQVS